MLPHGAHKAVADMQAGSSPSTHQDFFGRLQARSSLSSIVRELRAVLRYSLWGCERPHPFMLSVINIRPLHVGVYACYLSMFQSSHNPWTTTVSPQPAFLDT